MASNDTTDNPHPESNPRYSESSYVSPFSSNPYEYGNEPSSSSGGYTYSNPYDYSSHPPETSSGRPTTSSGFGMRPGTAKMNPFRQQAYQEQYGFDASTSRAGVVSRGGPYGIHEEEDEYFEEEEESEDEGLFAFLPPSTAEQQEERERQEQQQHHQDLNVGADRMHPVQGVGGASPFAFGAPREQTFGAQIAVPGHEYLSSPIAELPAYPTPTFDAYNPQRAQLPQHVYDPPQSPPSSDSNEGSRAGMGMGEFRMTRLDGARQSMEAEEKRKRSGSMSRRSSREHKDEDVEKQEEEAGKLGDAETTVGVPVEEFPPHFQNFQPNPARSNANSGPYKRHREYHHNQVYPQYAVASGNSVTSRLDTAGTGPGALPSTAGSGYGYGGDYEDQERAKERRRRRQKRAGTATTTGTATASEMGGYGAGSEYSGSHQRGPKTGGISEVDEASMSKSYYEGDRDSRDEDGMYDEVEGYEDGDSREGSIKMEFDFDAIEDEDSPYPEVRASVSNIDDPDMPALTIRMWIVGLLLCMTSSALNVFFNFRSPAPTIVPLVLLLLSYPVGKFMAFTLPITTYRIPLPCIPSRWVPVSTPRSIMRLVRPMTFPHAIEFSLNPGPWNIKEHVLVFIMANVAVGNPYALNAIVVLEVYYEFKTGYWFSLVLVLATQLTGFGLAGMCRRFLVWPASMVWPQNLVACTLLNTLHAEDEDDGIGMLGGPTLVNPDGTAPPENGGMVARKRGMSRYRFFMYTTIGSFFFFFLPGYLFEALSFFSFICWAAPTNVRVNQLFGVKTGLGMSVLTFDWTQITWIGSPLMVPWWAEVHIFAGFVLFYWIMTPILYYTNSWKLGHFPISANGPYDRFGNSYNIAGVLKPDGTFDLEAYNNYSPLFLPATYAVTYLLAFCLSTCVIIHTVLYHGHTLLNGFKKMRVENDDIHAKLMRNYPEVPDWWYASAFCAFFALAIVAVEIWDTSVPVWALLLSVLLPIIYILPSGFIYAMTGQGINLNILAQIIPGTLLPGKPLANMVFKAYSVQTLAEATSFVQDLKLGHYVKVPPRATFLVQLVATTLAAFVQVGVKQWIFDNVEGICQPDQKSQLTCPHNQVFYTASAVWGLIGPTRQFGVGSYYHYHLYAIVIGVFLPIPFWLWRRRYPNSWVKWVSTPVVLNGVSWIPPATGINYSSWFAIGFIFQYVVRKKNFAWWSKFNYVLSSALDSGTVIAVIVIFFTLQFPKTSKGNDIEVSWWGNAVYQNTYDWQGIPFLPIPDGGIPLLT